MRPLMILSDELNCAALSIHHHDHRLGPIHHSLYCDGNDSTVRALDCPNNSENLLSLEGDLRAGSARRTHLQPGICRPRNGKWLSRQLVGCSQQRGLA